MTKDRLNELKQKHSEAENGPHKIDVENSDKENSGKNDLRKIFERAEVVGQWIDNIEKNVDEVRVFLRKIENIQFNQKDVQDRLQCLFQNNTSIAQQITNKLKEIDEEMTKTNTESAEGRIKTIQYNTLKQRFKIVFMDSNRELENWKSIQKSIIQAQLSAKGNIRVSDEELDALLDEGKDIHIFTENILAETEETRRLLANVEERHQQLLKIERLLVDVRDLFVQMAILVDSQQELINRVEYHALSATDYVGAVDLKTVRESKRRYIKRKFCFILIIIILLLILFVILFK